MLAYNILRLRGSLSLCKPYGFAAVSSYNNNQIQAHRDYNINKLYGTDASSNAHYFQYLKNLRKPAYTLPYEQQTGTAAVAKYGGRYTVSMLPGHGIGPEMMGYVKDVFRYANVPVDFEEFNVHAERDDMEEMDLAITSIKRNGVAIKGNVETTVNRPNFRSRNVELREQLNLFAYVMHCHSFAGIQTRYNDIDIVIVRQNLEGEYKMLEHENVPGVVESLKIITKDYSEKLAHWTFEYAKHHNRKKVTVVHKANIMKFSDGLFLDCAKRVATSYPDIEFENMIVDNTCMQLVSKPQQFDVILTTNLYGSIVSNVICGLVGGAGLLSGKNYGNKYAIFEPGTRNTGTALVGKNIANPIAMLNAGADLLEHLTLDAHAKLIRDAIHQTVNVHKIHTPDIGGSASSTDVVNAIINLLIASAPTFFR